MNSNYLQIMRRIFLFFWVVTVFGCSESSKPVSNGLPVYPKIDPNKAEQLIVEQAIRSMQKLDKSSLSNIAASIKSRGVSEDRSIVLASRYYGYDPGSVRLIIDNQLNVVDTEYLDWKTKDTLTSIELKFIAKTLCDIGLFGVAIDTCRNTYMSLYDEADPEYVIVSDSLCLNSRYSYELYRDNVFKVFPKVVPK